MFLAASFLAASGVALGMAPVQADGVASERMSSASLERSKSAQVTIMGDSHIVLMINNVYPGAHANGNEGTRIDGKYRVYGLNGIKLHQVVNGRGVVKAGVRVVGRTNVNKWRKAISQGPKTIVVNLGTNDGGPKAQDIDKFMRLAGKDRRVFWIKPYYTSCPACRARHDYQLDVAAKRFSNLTLVRVNDLRLTLGSDGLHAFGSANNRALWNRIMETVDSRS